MTTTQHQTELEKYFEEFRRNTIGIGQRFESPFGVKEIIYADWVASGRMYAPIEEKMSNIIDPFVANTHSASTITSDLMTMAYHESKQIIKRHVNAGPSDVLVPCGSGMTAAVNKLQRILGLRVPEKLGLKVQLDETERPVIFVSHMEHHSNQTSWLETIGQVEIIPPNTQGFVDLEYFAELLKKFENRRMKIAAVTACSNVTGVETPYAEIAAMIHRAGGYCFVDFAASAPYVTMNMHPENVDERLDAIYFSPHKFLGGPGSAGILIFDSAMYSNRVPDHPGGGTVIWTNPWGEHLYIHEIEEREDGGTPPFLQTIRAALAVQLKEQMGVENILAREKELLNIVFDRFDKNPRLQLLESGIRKRLGAISFHIEGLYHALAVKMLNDRYGIQMRGGCDCAGTYAHQLLNISPEVSHESMLMADKKQLFFIPGWIRMSLHPTMSNEELNYICDALDELSIRFPEWTDEYVFIKETRSYRHRDEGNWANAMVHSWFA